MKKLLMAFVAAFFCSMPLCSSFWEHVSGIPQLIWFLIGILSLLLAVVACLFYLLYYKLKGNKFRIGGFVVLLFLGSIIYLLAPVDTAPGRKDDSCIEVPPSLTNFAARVELGAQKRWNMVPLISANVPTNSIELVQCCLSASNRAIASFFRSQGGLESSPRGTRGTYLAYSVFQILVVLYLVGFAFSYLGRDLFNALHIWMSNRSRTLAIWGYSQKSELLVQNLTKHDKIHDVVFMLPLSDGFDDDSKDKLIHGISKLPIAGRKGRCHWSFVDYNKLKGNDIVGKRNFFISESGRFNIALAQKVITAANDKRKDFVYYVRVETSADEKYFSTWIDDLSKDGVDVRILKESELIAESLVVNHPVEMRLPLDIEPGKKYGKAFKVLLIGFGTNGRSVLHKTIENSQCPWRGFSVDVVDTDYGKWQAYAHDRADAVREYNLSFVRLEFGTPSFADWLVDAWRQRRYDRIVACLGDDRATLSLCSAIEKIHRETFPKVRATPVFVQMDEPYKAFCADGGTRGGLCLAMAPYIKIFGMLNAIYAMRTIDDDRRLAVARWLNYWYGLEGQVPSRKRIQSPEFKEDLRKRWITTSYFGKCSNLASALGQDNLLRMLGYKPVKAGSSDLSGEDPFGKELEGKLADKRNLAVLAECEHMRWNAFHFVRGIRSWDMRSPSLDEVYAHFLDCPKAEFIRDSAHYERLEKVKQKMIGGMNRHAALVAFSDLPATDAALERFLCEVVERETRPNDPERFAGENKKRRGVRFRKDGNGGRYVWDFVDAMQENDYKFCRTLYENVRNSSCVLVRLNQEKEG